MRLRIFGGSCLLIALACTGFALAAAFIGTIAITQSADELTIPTAVAVPTSTTLPATQATSRTPVSAPASPDNPLIGVTIDVPVSTQTTQPIQATSTPLSSAVTPSLGMSGNTLGTLDYPLTVTAEAHIEATKVNAYRNSVNATRTAAARALSTKRALTTPESVQQP